MSFSKRFYFKTTLQINTSYRSPLFESFLKIVHGTWALFAQHAHSLIDGKTAPVRGLKANPAVFF